MSSYNILHVSVNVIFPRTFIIRAEDQVERAEWCRYIEACVAEVKGQEKEEETRKRSSTLEQMRKSSKQPPHLF